MEAFRLSTAVAKEAFDCYAFVPRWVYRGTLTKARQTVRVVQDYSDTISSITPESEVRHLCLQDTKCLRTA